MTAARVAMFLRERDRARLRGDLGIDRSLTADLRRLGVPDHATAADPTGKNVKRKAPADSSEPKKPGPRPKPRCEHEMIAERCPECNPELLAS